MSLKERIKRFCGNQRGGSELYLLELALSYQLVNGGAAQPQRPGNLVQFVCFSIQFFFLLWKLLSVILVDVIIATHECHIPHIEILSILDTAVLQVPHDRYVT